MNLNALNEKVSRMMTNIMFLTQTLLRGAINHDISERNQKAIGLFRLVLRQF